MTLRESKNKKPKQISLFGLIIRQAFKFISINAHRHHLGNVHLHDHLLIQVNF